MKNKPLKQFSTELVNVSELHPHPRNYRKHPDDQLAHLQASLKKFGIYRNIVIAKDGTILAGHGVVQAAKKSKLAKVPVIRLNVAPDSAAAIKVLTGDNEIDHLAEVDDRLLSELLKELSQAGDLLGTGFDEKMLANLAMITRPESEIKDLNEAAQWLGMPEFESTGRPDFVIVSFASKKDREAFAKKIGNPKAAKVKSIWYPDRPNEDVGSLRFEQKKKKRK